MSHWFPALVLTIVLSLVAAPASAVEMDASALVPAKQLFTANDLLWLEVRAGNEQLAESMDAYSSRSGVYLPLGQFSRVLDLAVTVLSPEQRAEGWILSRDRKLTLNLRTLTADVGGRTVKFTASQALAYKDDLYLRTDLIEALLPVKLHVEPGAQLLTVIPTEPLPFQLRSALSERRAGLSAGESSASVKPVETPYRLFTPPAIDVNVGGQMTRDGTDQSRQFSVRAASDLAYAGFRGFLGSDERGRINDIRLSLERKSPTGDALGPLGGVRAGIGDVFTPSAAIGVASLGGRGLFYSSAPLDNVDLSTPLNLRGELGLGEEVELYVNETLRASQATPVQGRYEFLNVPLSLGLNVIRLVFYGSQGQKREEVRRINLGAGQVGAGQLVVRFGAVQQDLSVIQIGRPPVDPARGELRAIGVVDYGVSSQLTVSGGFARYAPLGQTGRFLGLGGVRGSLGGMALQGDVALDDQGGRGATLGLAARPFGISIVAHHSEYAGGFVDETRQLGVTDDLVLVRASDFRADTSARLGNGVSIPLSFDVDRLERSDGSTLLSSDLRASMPVHAYYVSTSITYDHDTAGGPENDRLLAGVDISTLVARRIQLRAGLSYRLKPDQQIDSAYALADIQLSDSNGLHLGVVQAAAPHGELSVEGSHLYHARRFDIATNASYEIHSRQWRFGLQLAFSLTPDPVTHGYRMTRPGASTGGAVAVDAFVDENGDGVRQLGEPPVGGVVVDTPAGPIMTDAKGHARADNLGDAGSVSLRVNTEKADDPFLAGAPDAFEIVPRPGRIAMIEIPMRASAEVEITALLHRTEGADRPLSALNVELVPVGGAAPIAARTDHAGVAMFEGVSSGDYLVRLQPQQAEGLGLSLARPVRLTIPAGGGFVRGGEILIDVGKERMQ